MASDPGEKGAPDPVRRDEGGGVPVGTMFGLGFQFAAAILLSVLAGSWADRHFGSDPWGVLTGAFFGFGAGFFSIYRTVTAADRRAKTRRNQEHTET
jgi:F0F1-type ATP synthase assembly protein I